MKPGIARGLTTAGILLAFCATLALVESCVPAHAQTPSTPGSQSILGGYATLAVTTASARVALPAATKTFPVIIVLNDGTGEAFVQFGNASVVATTSSVAIPPGATQKFWVTGPVWQTSPASFIAAIGAATTTLRISQQNGP